MKANVAWIAAETWQGGSGEGSAEPDVGLDVDAVIVFEGGVDGGAQVGPGFEGDELDHCGVAAWAEREGQV